jgi:GT2 family glycosyltransferase
VTYYNLDYTKLCIDSVFRNTLYPNFELIVVDNASSDGTPEYLQQLAADHENVKVILNDRNLGFARANNQGVAVSSGSSIVLLNNDTVVPNGWLPKLMRHLSRPDLGLVVTVTNFSGNESRIVVPYTDLGDLEEFAARYTREHEGEMFDIRVAAMYCVAMRRDVVDKVGPLDEQFSVGMFEDDDYSERVRRAGYRVVCVEDVYIHHFGQVSFRKLSNSEYQAIWERNQKLYEKKWGVTWKPHTLRAGVR